MYSIWDIPKDLSVSLLSMSLFISLGAVLADVRHIGYTSSVITSVTFLFSFFLSLFIFLKQDRKLSFFRLWCLAEFLENERSEPVATWQIRNSIYCQRKHASLLMKIRFWKTQILPSLNDFSHEMGSDIHLCVFLI